MPSINPLDAAFLQLSPEDALTGRDLVTGCLITGSIGSGKSANILRQLVIALLRYR